MAKDLVVDLAISYGFQVLGAIVILAVGLILGRWLGRLADKQLHARAMEPPLRILIVRALRALVMVFAVVVALDKFGFQVAPLVAGIGVAGLGVGIALQGVLGNAVAGLSIIFTKPFRVGEYIEIAGVRGDVSMIALFSTTLLHADRSRVIIPNRKIVGEILHNYGKIRQLEVMVGVAYDTDLRQALAAIDDVLRSNPRMLKDPAPVIAVSRLAHFSIRIAVKPWVSVPDYVPAGGEIRKTIVETFRSRNIVIPMPQREVRLLESAA